MNPNAFRNLSYGVYLISTLDGSRPTGCIANSVMQITSEPATLALSMNHNNFTNSCIEKSGLFAVSVLAETSNPNLIAGFGFRSGKDVDKFENVEYKTVEGLPVVTDSCAYAICKVINKMETKTHTVFLGEVIDCDILKNDPAMTYAYYHKVVKGSSPKNAPTYLPPETEAANPAENAGTANASSPTEDKAKYVCSVCGYVYDGDTPFEELPDSYTCPVCGQPKSVFRKQ